VCGVTSTIDLARVRADTPGVAHVAHFNNAGAALPPRVVTEAITGHLDLESRVGGYEAEALARRRVAFTYDAIAALLNGHRDEVALVENATVAWRTAFYGLRFGPGDRILTSVCEYASNYIAYLQVAARTGAVVEVVPDDADGALDVSALERMVDGRVRLIAVTHVPTNGGLVNPAIGIGRVARAAGVPYLLDACQSVGQMPIDVAAIGCDMLSATGRKYLRGPRGTGFLWISRAFWDRVEPPMLDLHAATWVAEDRYELRDDARRYENWEADVAARIGLGVAVDYALNLGLVEIALRVTALAEDLRARLAALPGVTVRDRGRVRCGIVTFTVDGHAAEAVKDALAKAGINVTVSTRTSTLIDMSARDLDAVVRASVHYYNDDAEIDRLVRVVAALG
jgi:cysteine desulfurase / selenocysteine lyase